MKQLLVIAIALASTTAFASRARVTSLGNSPHIVDTQSIYTNPAKMFLMGDFVSMESGVTASTTVNANAEGQIVRSMGDAKAGLSLGHKSTNASAAGLRGIIPQTAALGIAFEQQNPIELSYGMKSGDMTWAATLVYSQYNDKVREDKETSSGIRLGALMGAWDLAAGIGLGNTVDSTVDVTAGGLTAGDKVEFKGTTGVSLFAGYTMNTMYYYGEVVLAGAKMDIEGTEVAKVESTEVTVGAVESMKKDGNEFFYGVALNSNTVENKVAPETKATSLTLPVIVGLEAEATSWLALRGSLTQTVLVNNSKDETTPADPADTEFAPGANNTVAAVGAGLKLNKVTVDGSLQGLTGGAAGQTLNGNTLLTTVGLTYMF